ncbi:MAG: TonB-dependent receptor [Flavobacteriia bacterium]|nr:TonB-dependent receptor [Flavobacteriia bacterium]
MIYGQTDSKKEVLIGAKVKSIKQKTGVITEKDGTFELKLGKELPDTLIFSAFGFRNDTLIVSKKDRFSLIEINLFSDLMLPEVVAEAKKTTHGISKLKVLQVEVIGEGELRKAACCNLSESFETNASVDVNITDAVSGAKKIQIMGLDGVYTQIQMENIPFLRGLESSFGLNSIPGTWIESIQITKGTGNVVNGPESMAGLINLELKKPENIERLYVNAYGNHLGRTELNAHGGGELNSKWKTANFVHAAIYSNEKDVNNDLFRDIPLSKNLSFLNRWRYDGKKMEAQFGINSYLEEKIGGQMGYFTKRKDSLYGVYIDNKHLDVFAKTGFLFEKKPYQSIGIVYQLKYHDIHAIYGNRHFYGEEKRGYINGIFDGIIGNTNHKIKTGLSLVYLDLNQAIDSISLPRVETITGAFVEYTFSHPRFTYVAGVRTDYHSLFGFQVSPRLHGKYSLTENIDLRFTGGKGFRTPNIMIDNISLLATSRAWNLPNKIELEESWNVGFSLNIDFYIKKRKNNFIIDFYRTDFVNQLIVDRDQSAYELYFLFSKGKSYSNAFQTEINFVLRKGLEFRQTYKYLDVKGYYNGSMRPQLMTQKHRFLSHLSYISKNKKWETSLTGVLNGKMRMNMFSDIYELKMFEKYTPRFITVNAQITYIYKKWDFYLGGENLSNFKVQTAILDAQNPFGEKFDASMVWGPIVGPIVYFGIRFKLKKIVKE